MTVRLTADQVQALTGDADRWLEELNAALIRWEINTPERAAMFLAQCAHESGGFRHLTESLNYSAARLVDLWPNRYTPDLAASMAGDERRIAEHVYGGRMGNAVEGGGDGWRYRGRGIIQLTGRENYRLAGQALGVDLTSNPDLACEPATAAQSAGWFWSTNGCNALADAGDYEAITRRINGGLNGWDDRLHWLETVRGILGAPVARQPAAPIEDRSTEYTPPTGGAVNQEEPMGAIALPLLTTLLPQVLGLFSQRAQATIAEKTGADPKLAEQFMQGLIAQVGQTVGVQVKNDQTAIQAVGKLTAEVQPGSSAAKALEDHSLDYLHQLTEAALALVDVRGREVQIETASADAAGKRPDAEVVRERIDRKLWWAYGIAGAILALLALSQLLKTGNLDGQIVGALILAFGALGGAIITMVNYGFGSSGSSGAKDVYLGEVALRQRQQKITNGGK